MLDVDHLLVYDQNRFLRMTSVAAMSVLPNPTNVVDGIIEIRPTPLDHVIQDVNEVVPEPTPSNFASTHEPLVWDIKYCRMKVTLYTYIITHFGY